MDSICAYPGTFDPPHKGHLRLVRRAARLYEHMRLLVVCSVNDEKTGKDSPWFTPEECRDLWEHYDLPDNVEIVTLQEFLGEVDDPKKVVMIRGVRNEDDVRHEQGVMLLNNKRFGIDQFFYIISECAYERYSSSGAREAARSGDLTELKRLVAPDIADAMMKRLAERRADGTEE